MYKLDLYDYVRKTAGERAVRMKAVEEYSELIIELGKGIEQLIQFGKIDGALVDKIISEISDVVVVTEQVSDEKNILNLIGFSYDYKLNRLENVLNDGELTKDMYL